MRNINWYVLHVVTGKECDIAKELNHRGFDAVVPQENRVIRKGGKWNQKLYNVFDGYVFVRMDYEWHKYYAISRINGIIRLLGGGKDPTPLSDNEAKTILKLTDLLYEPSVLRFDDNNNYEILSGFLINYKDKIVKIKRRNKKAIVRLTIAGEAKYITVSFVEQTPEQIKS